MVRAAIRGNKRWSCSTAEIEREGPSFSVDTVRAFHASHPDARIYLLIGSDNLSSFAAWKDPKEILRLSTIVVYARHGFPVTQEVRKRWKARLLRGDEISMSSTDIRQRIARGITCRFFVPEAVERYIQRHGLYTRQNGMTI
jgi:nicotinate-nucleotide adenylyltransferase